MPKSKTGTAAIARLKAAGLVGKIIPELNPPPWTLDDAIEELGSRAYAISQRWPREHLNVMSDQLRSLADELATRGELRE